MKLDILLLQGVSPIHVGTGRGEGAIDLPIARSVVTQFPMIPGSSIKGAMRHHLSRSEDPKLIAAAFGPSSANAIGNPHAGAVQFGDLHLLLMPVRSVSGTFAWVCCPHVLSRFKRDIAELNVPANLPNIPEYKGNAAVVRGNKLQGLGTKLGLEELLIEAEDSDDASDWANLLASALFTEAEDQTDFKERFCIVSNEQFAYFTKLCTDVRARVSIDEEMGVAKSTGLWFEENLPVESVLWGLIAVAPVAAPNQTEAQAEVMLEMLNKIKLMSIGGKTSVGRGLVNIQLFQGAA